MNQPIGIPPDRLHRADLFDDEPHERTLREIAQDVTPAIVEIWRGLMLRKWMILLITLLVTGVTVYALMHMTPIYRSTATVLIEQSKNKVVSIDEVYGGIAGNREYFQTQAEILKSHDVAERVVRKLGLASHPEFDPTQKKPPIWARWLPDEWKARFFPPPDPSDRQAIEDAVVAAFSDRLSVDAVRMTQLVKVGFQAADNRLAAEVANETANSYIAADMDTRFAMTQQANVWLNSRLAELKQKLDASEKALQDYREKVGIANTKGLAQGGQTQQVSDLTQKLVEARVKRTQVEEAYKQLQGRRADRYLAPAVVNHPTVAAAKTVEAAAEREFAEVKQKYGPAFPTYKEAEKKFELAKSDTKRQAEAVISSIEKEYRVALASERAMEGALTRVQGTIQATNRKEIDLGNFEREVATNRHLYETFLARVKETNAAGDIQSAAARVVDPAQPGRQPVKPKKVQIAVLALLGSLLGASMLAFLLNRLDNTVKTTDAVEARLGEPLLGALPKLSGAEVKSASRLVKDIPNSAFAEAVRSVNTAILLGTLDHPHKVIAITSALPGEGKSTLAINLALAQGAGKRVLLIDADLRRPVLSSRLGLDASAPGFTEILGGVAGLDSLIRLPDSNMHVLGAGKLPPNPHELFATERFRDVLTGLKGAFDLIILDCPPLQLVSDALLVGAQSTGLVFLVQAGETPVPLIRRNLKRIREGRVNTLGVVLNGHDFTTAERYYGEYSGYGKYGGAYYGAKG